MFSSFGEERLMKLATLFLLFILVYQVRELKHPHFYTLETNLAICIKNFKMLLWPRLLFLFLISDPKKIIRAFVKDLYA